MNAHEIGIAVLAGGKDSRALAGSSAATECGSGRRHMVIKAPLRVRTIGVLGSMLRLQMLCLHLHVLVLGKPEVQTSRDRSDIRCGNT